MNESNFKYRFNLVLLLSLSSMPTEHNRRYRTTYTTFMHNLTTNGILSSQLPAPQSPWLWTLDLCRVKCNVTASTNLYPLGVRWPTSVTAHTPSHGTTAPSHGTTTPTHGTTAPTHGTTTSTHGTTKPTHCTTTPTHGTTTPTHGTTARVLTRRNCTCFHEAVHSDPIISWFSSTKSRRRSLFWMFFRFKLISIEIERCFVQAVTKKYRPKKLITVITVEKVGFRYHREIYS